MSKFSIYYIPPAAKLCPTVLAVTETWFTDAAGNYDARFICPRGYSAMQKPRDLVRETKLGGGGFTPTQFTFTGLAHFHKNPSRQQYSMSIR